MGPSTNALHSPATLYKGSRTDKTLKDTRGATAIAIALIIVALLGLPALLAQKTGDKPLDWHGNVASKR